MSTESLSTALESPQTPPIKGRGAAMAFIWMNVFLSVLTYGIIAPTLPKLILSFLGGDVAHAAKIVGAIGTVFGLMHFLFSVVQGALSDRFGRRPILLSSNLSLAIDYIVMALAPSIGWLFAGRIVSGMSAASVMTSFAYITDITPPEQRTRAYGILGMAGGLGGMAGPALGGFLGDIDLHLPFWIAAGLSLANATYGYFMIPESLTAAHRAKLTWRRLNPFAALTILRTEGTLRRLLVVNLLTQFASVAMPTVFVLYTGWRYGWTLHDTGIAMGALGLGGLVVQGWLLGIAIKGLGEWRVLLVGLACNMAGLIVLGLAPTGLSAWVGLPLIALGGLAGPTVLSLITRLIPPNDQGHMLGSLSSAAELAGLAAPGTFAAIFAVSVGSLAGLGLLGIVFFAAALFFAASLLVVARRSTGKA